MPSSNLAIAPVIMHLVWDAKHNFRYPIKRILDVGPGRGKYAVLLREYVDPLLIIDAVEAEQRYITPRLRAIYDSVYWEDVTLMGKRLDNYDLVLMVDVIEHIDKEIALELLNRIPGWIVICTPQEWFQNPEHEEFPFEEHRSLWTAADFGDRLEHDASQLGGLIVRLKPLDDPIHVRK